MVDGPGLWRLETGLTLTSGTASMPELVAGLTVGSIDPRSSLELDIWRQNLLSLKSPLFLADEECEGCAQRCRRRTRFPLGGVVESPGAVTEDDEAEAVNVAEAGTLTSSSSLSLVSL